MILDHKAIARIDGYDDEFRKASVDVHGPVAARRLWRDVVEGRVSVPDLSGTELEQLRRGQTLERFVWHHDAERGRMLLVRRTDHAPAHIGGRAMWEGR